MKFNAKICKKLCYNLSSMSVIEFNPYFHPSHVDQPKGLACVGVGMEETLQDYEVPKKFLDDLGFDIVFYFAAREILLSGDAQDLIDFVNRVNDDYLPRLDNYGRTICVGGSLNAQAALNTQRAIDEVNRPGLERLPSVYAAAGIPPSHVVFHAGGFRGIDPKHALADNYDEATLSEAWRGYEIDPKQPLIRFSGALLLLGTADTVIRHQDALENVAQLNASRDADSRPIKTEDYFGGHKRTLRNFREDFPRHFANAQMLASPTI